MIKCHLSRLMGERKLKVADISRDLSIDPGTLGRLYREEYTRINKDVIDKLCKYFDCQVSDLFEYIED